MVIYKITNSLNHKIYIGQTVVPINRRWSQHKTSTKNTPLYAAIRKYGADNFKIEIIHRVEDPNDLNTLEQKYIKEFNCLAPNGYNLTTGGDSAFCRSEETKEKQRDAMLGHEVSVETRDKIANTLKGRPGVRKGVKLSDETRAKISSAQIGRKASEETRAKMSAAHKERLAKNSSRSPAQLEALTKMHNKNKGRAPWNKGRKVS